MKPSRFSATALGEPLTPNSLRRVQRQVQLQHIHSRIAQKTELSPFGVLGDQLANRILAHAARLGHALRLVVRVSGVISGSSPEAEVVTASMGTGFRDRFLERVDIGLNALLSSFTFDWGRFDPPELVAS